LKKLWVFIFLAVLVILPGASHPLSSYENELFHRINEERARNGLSPLTLDSVLSDVAVAHSLEMLNNGYFDHISAVDGSDPYTRVERSGYYDGYDGMRLVAENLGLTEDGINIPFMFQQWMESPGHRANILNSVVNEVGVGIAQGVYRGTPNAAVYAIVFAYYLRQESLASSTATTARPATTTTLTTFTTAPPSIIVSTTRPVIVSSVTLSSLSATSRRSSATLPSLTHSVGTQATSSSAYSTTTATTLMSKTQTVTLRVSILTFATAEVSRTKETGTSPKTTVTLNSVANPSTTSLPNTYAAVALPGFSPFSIIVGLLFSVSLIPLLKRRSKP